MDGLHTGPAGSIARAQGVNMRKTWQSAGAQLVTCEADFDPVGGCRDLPHRPTWVGAITSGTTPGPAQEPPLVLVSLSSTWMPGQTDVYQRIITALAALPVRRLVTLGGVTPDRRLTVAANVEVRDYANHDEIMPAASIVIGHGGHATTFAALADSKPLLILPMHPLMDQPVIGASVARAGAGLMLNRTATAEQSATAVKGLLSDSATAQSAAAIGDRLRSADAASRAANRLLELARVARL